VAFEPLSKKSLAASVFEQIRDGIVDGTLEAGERLPAERVLAEKLQVNRQAVREGLQRLAQMGLVATRQGGGTKVLDFRRTAGLELMARLIVTRHGIDTALAGSVLEMRTQMGTTLARLCAKRASPDAVARITAAATRLREAAGDLPRQQTLALRFWDEVVDGASNLAYRLAFNSLQTAYGQVMQHLTSVMADEVSAVDDYDRLAAAIAGGNPTAAVKAATAITERGDRAVRVVLDALQEAER
jgi:DNA-binding FadR family transcriptional regulator